MDEIDQSNESNETNNNEQEAPNNESQENSLEALLERAERAENELKKVRDEAAARRVENKELSQKLSGAKSPEEFEAAVNEYQTKIAEFERRELIRDVADAHKVPAALRDRLRGESREELEADAKALLEAFPQGDTRSGRTSDRPPSGGVNPSNDDPDDEAVISAAVKRAASRF